VAPLLAPFGSLVPQTRVRIRATGSASYGRSIPTYPPEWGGGTTLPDDRDLRDAWPEGVTLPRAIVYNLACTTLGLPAVTSDIAVLDRRAAVILERHVPGYREIIASELPHFVKEAAGLVFGRKLAENTARRCLRAAAALWVDARTRADLVAPTCLFAMQYLRYMAEDSESWDETKEHESQTTREEELIRETSSVAFAALCAERPGDRWPVLQSMVDAEDAAQDAFLRCYRSLPQYRSEASFSTWLFRLALTTAVDEALPVPNCPPKPASGKSSSFTNLRTFQRLHRLMNTATGAHDNMAIAAFARHVVRLPAGGYNTTQFDMTDDERDALVDAGRQTMRTFLASQTVLEGTREIGGGDFAPSAESTWMANDAAGTILQR